MRSFVLILCFLLGMGMVQPAAAQTNSTSTDLRLLTVFEDKNQIATLRYLLDVFEVLNDGIRISIQSVAPSKLVPSCRGALTREAHGQCPDIVHAFSEQLAALSDMGVLDTDLATQTLEDIGVERFYDGALSHMQSAGSDGYFAVPYHGWLQGIWYRADWFEKAGLYPPNRWGALLKAAQYFTDKEQGRYGIVLGKRDDSYTEQIFAHLAAANGASVLDANGRPDLANERIVETLDYYKQLAAYAPPGDTHWRARDYFLQGKAAMMFYSTYIMDDLALPQIAENSLGKENFPELDGAPFDPEFIAKTGMISVLHGRQEAAFGAVLGLAFAKNDDPLRKAAVQKLVRFLLSTDAHITLLQTVPGGFLPTLRGIAGSEDFLRDPKGVFKRYGRRRIQDIVSGLDRVQNLAMIDAKPNSAAAHLMASGVIGQMVYKALHEKISSRDAATWATNLSQKP